MARKSPRNLKQKFNLSPEEYDSLLEKQNRSCAICLVSYEHLDRKLAVDHDHGTMEIRGLLCDSCNFLLGLAHDDPSILIKAASYLDGALRDVQLPSEIQPMKQLHPSIPIEVVENDLGIPIGKGRAIGWIDYSEEDHLIWITLMDRNRQCWQVPNPYIRAQSNPTVGRK